MNDEEYNEFYHEEDDTNEAQKEQLRKDLEAYNKRPKSNKSKKDEVDEQWQRIQNVTDTIKMAPVDGDTITKIIKNSKSRIVIETKGGKVLVIEAITDENGSASIEISI